MASSSWPSSAAAAQKGFLSDLSYILDNASRCATFTCGGRLPILTSPSTDESGNLKPRTEEKVQDQRVLTKGVSLRWGPNGQGRKLTIPLQTPEDQQSFEQLLEDCISATFGRGGEDVYDETYRRAVAMDTGDFMTDFCPYEAGIIDIVTQILLPPITGDLTPFPPRSKVMRKYELNHAQAAEIDYAIDNLARKQGTKIDVRDVQACLNVLNVGPANAQEMLEISGLLDPKGTMYTEREALFELAAKRVRERWLGMNPGVPDPKVERRKMVSRGIRAELYKLNVYSGPSGLFKPHVDTPRSEFQIGSLVVCLPVKFEGGALAVRHKMEEVVYDGSKDTTITDDHSVQWAAFYSDCEHEVREVTSGHRVTLTYNLFLSPGTGLSACRPLSLDRSRLPPITNLKAMLSNNKFMPKGGYLGIHLAHRYPHTHPKLNQFVPNMLKGVDMVVHESISTLGVPAVLCTVSKTNAPHADVLTSLNQIETAHLRKVDQYEDRPVVNYLATFEADFRCKEDELGEEDAQLQLADYCEEVAEGEFETDSEDEVPDDLQDCRQRFAARKAIHWVNQAKHKELGRAYMVYGNEAELRVQYECAAIVVKIPKLSLRKGKGAEEQIEI